ncbi:hepatitis A virus cellular receptor 1 homolog isoform X2 [Dendrobates tinctorius]|uniref:hepatitis A virus cellular receptor 1 homolog isoform X2 n=1 Tax=Dendrobates tinctorius TaxID=92724 RepID=UPI003CCA0576
MSPGSEKKTMKTSAAGCLYFLHLVVVTVSGEVVTGSVKDTLTLPCTYTVHKYQHHICWGRGECPLSGCNNEIIRTDGQNVTMMKSDRYHLLGNISQGDVSLTITGVTKEDEGTYCCRVQIPGLFNDKKIDRKVMIREVDNATMIGVKNPEPGSTTARTTMNDTYHLSNNSVSFTTLGTSDASKVNIEMGKPQKKKGKYQFY